MFDFKVKLELYRKSGNAGIPVTKLGIETLYLQLLILKGLLVNRQN